MNSLKLAEDLFRSGQIEQSLSTYQHILKETPNNLTALHNIAVIEFQLAQYSEALEHIKQALTVDPFNYAAHYNRFLIYSEKKQPILALKALKASLSCALVDSAQKRKQLKTLNKAINICPANLHAYVARAQIYEQKGKDKLAVNDFQRATFELNEAVPSKVLSRIYQLKACFYRRKGKMADMRESFALYLKHQNRNCEKTHLDISESCEVSEQAEEISAEIKELAQQLINTISNRSEECQTSERNMHQNYQADQSLSLMAQSECQKSNSLDLNAYIKTEENLLGDENEEGGNQENYQEQDSSFLNRKINEIQTEIKESGGHIPEVADVSKDSQQDDLLSYEISKAVEEINTVKVKEMSKSHGSHFLPSKSEISDSPTMRSKISVSELLSLNEISPYDSFSIDIVTCRYFEDKSYKNNYVKLFYGEQEKQTDKLDKMQWDHRFDYKIKHSDNEEDYLIELECWGKDSGWLSWGSEYLVGKTTVNLLDKNSVKSTIVKDESKIGILFYKIKLIQSKEADPSLSKSQGAPV